jgi:hypothetical protein
MLLCSSRSSTTKRCCPILRILPYKAIKQQSRPEDTFTRVPYPRFRFQTQHSLRIQGIGYSSCLLLLFDSGKEDLLETIQEEAGEKRTIFEKNEKPKNMETRKE